MSELKLQIKKDGVWRDLDIYKGLSPKYNSVVNKIGSLNTREISHSNTYSLPKTSNNVQLFSLSSYNYDTLARGLNRKYEGRVLYRSAVINESLVVINNLTSDEININMIDKALLLLDKWASKNYYELLNDQKFISTLKDNDIALYNALKDIRNYTFTDTYVSAVENVSGRNFPICYFPNSVNQIGDEFNVYPDKDETSSSDEDDNSGERIPKGLVNPLQSRPAYNVRAFLELVCRGFGYAPIFDSGVDVDILNRTAMLSGTGNQSIDPPATETVKRYKPNTYLKHSYTHSDFSPVGPRTFEQTSLVAFERGISDNERMFIPSVSTDQSIPNISELTNLVGHGSSAWKYEETMYKPINITNAGSVSVFVNFTAQGGDNPTMSNRSTIKAYALWESEFSNDAIYESLATTTESASGSKGQPYKIKIDKNQEGLNRTPAGASEFLGIVLIGVGVVTVNKPNLEAPTFPISINMKDMEIHETYTPLSEFGYDQYRQYTSPANLTVEAPRKSVQKLVSGILKQQGLLVYINDYDKKVHFFDYESYLTPIINRSTEHKPFPSSVDDPEVYDLSDYILNNRPVTYNTDFGNDFARVMDLSLNNPFKGNVSKFSLPNQSESSKYVEFKSYRNDTFSDISEVKLVNIGTIYEYFEMSVTGLSLMTFHSRLNLYNKFDPSKGKKYGSTDLYILYNYNYDNAPKGLLKWLDLVGIGVKVTAWFRFPAEVIKRLDLRKPVFIHQLRGYFIIDEIKEFKDSETPVEVTLIKPNYH